jgi:hypothetical protein
MKCGIYSLDRDVISTGATIRMYPPLRSISAWLTAVRIGKPTLIQQLTDHIKETGGLFRLISRLMRSEATKNRYFKPDHTVYSDPG